MKTLRYAITGANGNIGVFLVKYLRQHGHVVYELVRSPEKAMDVNYYKYFDLANSSHILTLHGIDILIHAAYFMDTRSIKYKDINIIGSTMLFQQASIDSVKYVVFISTVSAYSTARSLYGNTKYQLEQLLINSNCNAVVVRPGLVLHKSLHGIAATIDNFVKKSLIIPLIGNGSQLIYPCFLEDLARCILTLSMQQLKIKKPIIAAAEQALTFRQLVQYLAKHNHKQRIFIPIPFSVIYLLLKSIEFFKLPIGLRSDSLLGMHYGNKSIDFSETRNLGINFNKLIHPKVDICG